MGWAPVITSLSFFCVSFFAGKWKGKSAARGMGHGQEGHHSAQSAIQAPTPVQDRNPAQAPAGGVGVVQRSLALYLPCFVSLSPWMAESHLTPIIIPYSPRTNHPLSATAIVAHDFPSWFFSRRIPFYDTVRLASLH